MAAMTDFPRSLIEFQQRFGDEGACAQYLIARRWPDGFVCPGCGGGKAWRLETKPWTYECSSCGRQTSITAGTIMHHSKLPLTAWFWAAYLMATHSNGISALQLQRQLAFGSYKTAWLLCAKLRRSMLAPGRSPLAGLVEVDETEIACRSKNDPVTGGGGRSHQGKMLVVLGLGRLSRAAPPAPPILPGRVCLPLQPPAHPARRIPIPPRHCRRAPASPLQNIDLAGSKGIRLQLRRRSTMTRLLQRIRNRELHKLRLWGSTSTIRILKDEDWRFAAIDLKIATPLERSIAAASILEALYRDMVAKPKVTFFVIDEAHNFCPRTPWDVHQTAPTQILQEIAAEG